jgi:hypothetical protein
LGNSANLETFDKGERRVGHYCVGRNRSDGKGQNEGVR